jgi:hypothetical protein
LAKTTKKAAPPTIDPDEVARAIIDGFNVVAELECDLDSMAEWLKAGGRLPDELEGKATALQWLAFCDQAKFALLGLPRPDEVADL